MKPSSSVTGRSIEMIDFLLSNWDSVLVVVVLVAVLVFLSYKGKRGLVDEIIYRVVTELEREYASGTGNLKLAAAIETIYPKLPAVIRVFTTTECLKTWIEKGLSEAKEKWAKNSALTSYINEE